MDKNYSGLVGELNEGLERFLFLDLKIFMTHRQDPTSPY